MTDRVPGAPGQYQAVISAEEFQKLQSGESFSITLNRDDQPITQGTPYNKASVLPDELAAQVCPNVEDPTPADAFQSLTDRCKKHLLWQNADTGSELPEQGITLGDISQYTEYIVETVNDGCFRAKVGRWTRLTAANIWENGAQLFERKMYVYQNEGTTSGAMTIAACNLLHITSAGVQSLFTDNSRIIVTAVYGIKGVDE